MNTLCRQPREHRSADTRVSTTLRVSGFPRRVRLVDVAEATGLDVSTVSRVLNGDPRQSVREETRQRIQAAARRLGYRPNALARALKQSRTGAVAFVVPMVRNPIWSVVERGALERAAHRGYDVLVVSEPPDRPRAAASYQPMVLESRVDGLILATNLRPRGRSGPDLTVPHVYLNRRGPRPGHDVVMDEEGAVGLWLAEMARRDRRELVLLDGPRSVDTVYRRAMAARANPGGQPVRVVHAPATEQGGWDATWALLHRAGRRQLGHPGGIGVGSLPQLTGVVAALRAAGVAVPASTALVSFDDDPGLSYLGVPVTSVAMPLVALGAAGVDALVDQIGGMPARDVLLGDPMTLVGHEPASPPRQPTPDRPGRIGS